MSKASSAPENQSHAAPVEAGSERAFGVVFAVVFAIIAAWPLFKGGEIRLWSAGLAAVFLVLALMAPGLLKPLNIIWFKFGLVLHAVVNPLVMGLMFYLTVMPTGLIMRLLGKDILRLKRDGGAESYWIERTPPGPEPQSMKNQF